MERFTMDVASSSIIDQKKYIYFLEEQIILEKTKTS